MVKKYATNFLLAFFKRTFCRNYSPDLYRKYKAGANEIPQLFANVRAESESSKSVSIYFKLILYLLKIQNEIPLYSLTSLKPKVVID